MTGVPTPTAVAPPSFKYRLLTPDGVDQLRDAPDAHRRLQALVANWLRMENIVCLLGAGCSANDSIHGMTMPALEESLLKLASEKWQTNSAVKALLDDRIKEHAKKDAIDFEGWLSILSNVVSLSSVANSPIAKVTFKSGDVSQSDLVDLLKDIERIIYGSCGLQLADPADKPSGHHAFFAKLIARDPALGRAQIFTTNYDTIIEQALDHLGIHYFDGFSGRTEPRFDPSSYGLDIYYPGDISQGRVRRFDRFAHLYKLHGSVHWMVDNGRIGNGHIDLGSLKKWRDEKDLKKKAAELTSIWPHKEQRLGILPTANKFVQTLDAPFSYLFRIFQQRLQAPQTFLFVAGYGFADEHVNAMIETGMANVSMTLLILTPAWLDIAKDDSKLSNWIKRHRHLGERIFVLCPSDKKGAPATATFDDFSNNVMPQVKWLEEFSALRRLEKSMEIPATS